MKKVVPCFSEGRLESTSILFNSSINKCFGIIIVIEGTEDSLKVNSCFITPFFTTFSEQFRLVTYITMYVGIVESSGKMLVTFHHRLCELVAISGMFML